MTVCRSGYAGLSCPRALTWLCVMAGTGASDRCSTCPGAEGVTLLACCSASCDCSISALARKRQTHDGQKKPVVRCEANRACEESQIPLLSSIAIAAEMHGTAKTTTNTTTTALAVTEDGRLPGQASLSTADRPEVANSHSYDCCVINAARIPLAAIDPFVHATDTRHHTRHPTVRGFTWGWATRCDKIRSLKMATQATK
mmetsp:Transcript_65166/g.128909  ORF Transcript_65166/g.128909 Transcript_65166/m.128909 type:complete len:200 (-) Transcript_65166:43-642(-)